MAALQQARRLWGQAQTVIKPELDAQAADPYSTDPEGGRRQRLTAQDRGGYLRRAEEAARRAVVLAKSPQETYEATLWLALLECDRGHHRAELQHTRRLVVLQPRNPASWGALRRAAECNGLGRLAHQADVAARELGGEPMDTPEDHP
jgi:hypothetical protein